MKNPKSSRWLGRWASLISPDKIVGFFLKYLVIEQVSFLTKRT